MMRTTLDLDSTVVEELRRRGAREGKSMGAVASEVLAVGLAHTRGQEPRALAWTSRDLGRPRVDLEDKEALRALLERE
jgi:plasmid stability protein